MKQLIIAIALVLVLAAPALAGACQIVREPAATICHYGDPRILFTFDNAESTVPVAFKGVFANARTGERQSFIRTVAAGATVRALRWGKGGGSRASVYDDGTGELLARITVSRTTGLCGNTPS